MSERKPNITGVRFCPSTREDIDERIEYLSELYEAGEPFPWNKATPTVHCENCKFDLSAAEYNKRLMQRRGGYFSKNKNKKMPKRKRKSRVFTSPDPGKVTHVFKDAK